ncbi:MAG: copA, partial [Nitrospirae bacterium]|nr:copA [Nitrospirota bacterium]
MSEDVHRSGTRIDLPVTGMSCASCASHIQEGLSGLRGVHSASVNFAAEKATVFYDQAAVSVDDFIRMIREQGYGVSISRIQLPVKGMSCASCVATVQEALTALPGVVSASVNFATEKATVDYFPSQVGIRDFRKVIKDAGYELVETEKGEDIVEKEQREREAAYLSLKRKVISGAV